MSAATAFPSPLPCDPASALAEPAAVRSEGRHFLRAIAAGSPLPNAGAADYNTLSPDLPAGVWKGNELGQQVQESVATGWPELDAQLPGGGWPRRSLTEVLSPQPSVIEWRLLAGVLAPIQN